jgi:hypothetical protein
MHYHVQAWKEYDRWNIDQMKVLNESLKRAKAREIKMSTGSAAMHFNIDFALDNSDRAFVKDCKNKYLRSALVWQYIIGQPLLLEWIIYV